MKTRVLTAVIGVPFILLLLAFHQTLLFNAVGAAASVLAVYELLHNTGYVKQNELLIPALLMAIYLPFSLEGFMGGYGLLPFLLFFAVLVTMLFLHHNRISFVDVAITLFGGIVIPFLLSSVVFIRGVLPEFSLYCVVLCFTCPWISDIGGYFGGRFFGKHKLCPTISPKKTVEGLIVGVLSCVAVNVIFTLVYANMMKATVAWGTLIVALFCASLLSTVGDLFASIIKRQVGIKDYGQLLPGHGGILDRCDSMLFTAPFLWAMFHYFSVFSLG